jgi:hypothetical protein
MATRQSLAERVINVTRSSRLRLIDAGRGWPALAEFEQQGQWHRIALFVGPIGDAYRENRRQVERRWQNPAGSKDSDLKGLPVVVPDGYFPVLLGAWFDDPFREVRHPVFAVADATRRVGKTTRHSIFVEVAMLEAAASQGWAEGANGEGEPVTYFHPGLFPAYLDLALMDVEFPTARLADIAAASGVTQQDNDFTRERARRLADVVVRDSRFRQTVVRAYDGLCAMCGLNLGIVEGAHIYPASAPQSPDIVNNGLALCPNHHAAFDRNKIAVDPNTMRVQLSPDLHASRHRSPMSQFFVEHTVDVLRRPVRLENAPSPDFFHRRNLLYGERLAWAR